MSTTTSESLVWVITGTSTGLGRYLALAALARGDKVIATSRARSLGKLDDLKAKAPDSVHTMELDVTASLDTLKRAAEEAVKVWGRVDVVVNNAGYIDVGALEERTPEESLNQYQTNVFGALNVSRAFLPYMRERKTGTVVFIGSLGGWMCVHRNLRDHTFLLVLIPPTHQIRPRRCLVRLHKVRDQMSLRESAQRDCASRSAQYLLRLWILPHGLPRLGPPWRACAEDSRLQTSRRSDGRGA